MVPGLMVHPARTSAKAAMGRRGAWAPTRPCPGTRELLATPPQPRLDEAEERRTRMSDVEQGKRLSPGSDLHWLGVLIAISSAILAFTLSMS